MTGINIGGRAFIVPDCCAGEWIRVGLNTEQTVSAAGGAIHNTVQFDAVNDANAGSAFDTAAASFGFPRSGIQILEDGIYALTFRLWIKTMTDTPFTTEINGIDYDTFLYYEKTHDPVALAGFGVHDSYVFRSGPSYGATPPIFYVDVGLPAAATVNLVIDDGGMTGTYMEIMKLIPAVVGDPYTDEHA